VICCLCLQVNAAVEELAGFAETCAKAMSSVARNQLARVGAEERIRLQELYHSIAVSSTCVVVWCTTHQGTSPAGGPRPLLSTCGVCIFQLCVPPHKLTVTVSYAVSH
jgi:hypothetical protein